MILLAGFLLVQMPAGNPWSIIPPPARYNHAYHGKLTTITLTPQQVYSLCWKLGGTDARACSSHDAVSCTIILPNDGDPQILARLRQHEIAHCNGWPANHPQ